MCSRDGSGSPDEIAGYHRLYAQVDVNANPEWRKEWALGSLQRCLPWHLDEVLISIGGRNNWLWPGQLRSRRDRPGPPRYQIGQVISGQAAEEARPGAEAGLGTTGRDVPCRTSLAQRILTITQRILTCEFENWSG